MAHPRASADDSNRDSGDAMRALRIALISVLCVMLIYTGAPARAEQNAQSEKRIQFATFSLAPPRGWTREQKDNNFVAAYLLKEPRISIYVYALQDNDRLGDPQWLQKVIDSDDQVKRSESLAPQSLTVGTETRMAASATVTLKDNFIRRVRVATSAQDRRRVRVFVSEDPNALKENAQLIEGMLSTFVFNAPKEYGYDLTKTLRIAGPEPSVKTLNLFNVSRDSGYAQYLYSGLTRLSPTLEVVPDLAKRWVVSPDQTTYTFTLRADAMFADGSPITARTVHQSWNLLMFSNTFTDLFISETRAPSPLSRAELARMIEVVDERTLVIRLQSPKPFFAAGLAHPAFAVSDRAVIQNNDFAAINASGPFVFDRIIDKGVFSLKRNPRYHTPPSIEHILVYYGTIGSRLSLYQNGLVDVLDLDAQEVTIASSPDWPMREDLTITPRLCAQYLVFNTSAAPFDDLWARRAFAAAIDKRQLMGMFEWDPNDAADTLLPPALAGHLPRVGDGPTRADEHWRRSRYASRTPLVTYLSYGDSQNPDEWFAALAAMWRQRLNVVVAPTSTFDTANPATQNPSIVISGHCTETPDPAKFLDGYLHSRGNRNLTGFSEPIVDAYLDRARGARNPAERIALYQQLESYLLDNALIVPLHHPSSAVLAKPYVRGYVNHPLNILQADRVTIDAAGWRR
jgi:oligopeptide transport system substrate-binding protein